MTTADHGRIDPAVVAALYERYAEELRLFLTGVLHDADLASEALQNTFTKAVESGHTAREESLKAWLFQVGFHEAILLRRRSRLHDRSLREMVSNDPARVGNNPADLPIERLARAEMNDRVRQAIGSLPEEQRQVVQLRIYQEKTFAVIADELSIPIGTVLTRMRLALQKLSRGLGREK